MAIINDLFNEILKHIVQQHAKVSFNKVSWGLQMALSKVQTKMPPDKLNYQRAFFEQVDRLRGVFISKSGYKISLLWDSLSAIGQYHVGIFLVHGNLRNILLLYNEHLAIVNYKIHYILKHICLVLNIDVSGTKNLITRFD